jgi:hypothetical protein
MVPTNVTTFGVAVGATGLRVAVEDEGGYQKYKNAYCLITHVHGFQIHLTWPSNVSIGARYKGVMFLQEFRQIEIALHRGELP